MPNDQDEPDSPLGQEDCAVTRRTSVPGGVEMSTLATPGHRKAMGAYYTDAAVSRFLAAWALRQATDTVLEPSFGGGAFLRAAADRLTELGGKPSSQVFGCELDTAVHADFCLNEADQIGVSPCRLTNADFFALNLPRPVTAVIGNPPFVRYQRFAGPSRRLAIERTRRLGVAIPELASSWAPFVVVSAGLLEPGGRLAFVAPTELLHATYARPVLDYLGRAFGQVDLLTFERRLFPGLSQDTLLILAADFGTTPHAIRIHHLQDAAGLSAYSPESVPVLTHAEAGSVTDLRPAALRISPEARRLYRQLTADERIRRLGSIASVSVGYVTGANDYFHLTENEAATYRIDHHDLRRAIRRGRDLRGCGLDAANAVPAADEASLLFCPQGELDEAAAAYVLLGEQQGIDTHYKCRVRKPWWRVPGVIAPDLILTVMAGDSPRLVANSRAAVVTNSLHAVRLRAAVAPRAVAAAAVNTLTALSAELEGHALGGGMLKLEPREAANLLLPWSNAGNTITADQSEALAVALASGDATGATALGDVVHLEHGLGLSSSEIALLREALRSARQWRLGR